LFGTRESEEAPPAAPAVETSADAGTAAEDRRALALAEWRTVRAMPLQALRQRMRVREIAEFSRLLDTLCIDIGDPALRAEAERLHLAVQRFDVNQMKRVLDRLAAWTDDGHQPQHAEEASDAR
jgi:hypothetical protein